MLNICMRKIPPVEEVKAKLKAVRQDPDFDEVFEQFMRDTTSSAGYKKEW